LREPRKACLPIALSFDQFELGHLPFYHAIIDPPGEPGPHCIFVLRDSCGKGLQFGDVALFYLIQPVIKELSRSLAEQSSVNCWTSSYA
jgi:hypothetical protein